MHKGRTKIQTHLKTEIDELLANSTPLEDAVANENDSIPLDNTNTTVKNEQYSLNEIFINETGLHEEGYPTQDV